MIAEAGLVSLWLAAGLAAYQFLLMILALRGDIDGGRPMRAVAIVQGILSLIAFASLLLVFARTDMSVALVFENSHSAKPFIYKVAGAWGNHEGSMLMWVTILAVAGAFVATFSRRTSERTLMAALGSQSVAGAGLLCIPADRFESVRAPVPGAARWAGPQSIAPGPGFGLPSADAVPWLCRSLGGL